VLCRVRFTRGNAIQPPQPGLITAFPVRLGLSRCGEPLKRIASCIVAAGGTYPTLHVWGRVVMNHQKQRTGRIDAVEIVGAGAPVSRYRCLLEQRPGNENRRQTPRKAPCQGCRPSRRRVEITRACRGTIVPAPSCPSALHHYAESDMCHSRCCPLAWNARLAHPRNTAKRFRFPGPASPRARWTTPTRAVG